MPRSRSRSPARKRKTAKRATKPVKRKIGYVSRKPTATMSGKSYIVWKVGVRGKPFYLRDGKRHYVKNYTSF